ncbi:MAG: hemerythrin domain-containing protein [Saccharofermentanales bacterium]
MRKATQDLKNEHDTILHVFKVMDKVISSAKRDEASKHQIYNDYVYFLRTFVNKCHHGKEETYLFKDLELAGVQNEDGPIGQMLKEHAQGKAYVIFMGESLESGDLEKFKKEAAHYEDLLTNHMKKETSILFSTTDKLLDNEKQDLLFKKFEEHEENVLGHGVHEELMAMIRKWEADA